MSRIIVDATGLDSAHRTRGIGRYVRGLVDGLIELSAGDSRHDLQLLRAEGAEVPSVTEFGEIRIRRSRNRGAAWMFVENQLRLNRLLAGRAELFHATSMEGSVTGLPWVATCHDLIPLDLRGPYLRPWNVSAQLFWRGYVRRLRTGPARVIAISDHVRTRLVEAYGLDRNRVDVVHHGVAEFWRTSVFGTPPAPVLAATQRPFLLFVGGFDSRKNQETLFAALHGLAPGERVSLIVAGSRDADDRRVHDALLRRHPIDATFLEYVDDSTLRWLYARAVALIFSSVSEGWGLPIVEAMAASCPVVCADFGSMAEAAGGAALAVDVRSPEAIAGVIRRLASTPALGDELRARGRERVEALTWRGCAEGTRGCYEQALAGA